MKINKEIYNDHIKDDDVDGSDDEDEENEQEGDEDQDQDEDDVNDNNGDSQEDDDEDGDELEDDEDEPPETNAPNIGTEAVPKQKQSLGGDNKKVALKIQANGVAAKKSQRPIAKLVIEAIKHLNERGGSSTVAIKRVIISNHPDMNERRLGLQIKRYVKTSLDNGTMIQIKRSFKITKKLDVEQRKLSKEREKARREKLKEKAKEMKKNKKLDAKEKEKNNKTKKMQSDAKEKAKSAKRPSPSGDKAKPIKKIKVNGATSKAAKEGKEQSTKVPSATAKIKVKSRKSINLLIKHTPPRPKTMKKLKPADEKQKPNSTADAAVAETSKAAATATGRGKKTKAA